MNGGTLTMEQSKHQVRYTHRTPKMIVASRSDIKLYVRRAIDRNKKVSGLSASLTVFLTFLPLSVTDQKFSPILALSSEMVFGVVLAVLFLSGLLSIKYAYYAYKYKDQLDENFVIEELLNNEDSTGGEFEYSTSNDLESFNKLSDLVKHTHQQ